MGSRTLAVRLLGGFGVVVDGRLVPPLAWRRRSAADLVKLLALDPRRRLSRDQVVDALWPALDDAAGAANTRKAAHFARRAMGLHGGVVLSKGWVELAPGFEIVTDVGRFEGAVARAVRQATPAGYAEAATAYGGDLLPDDRYAEWCASARDRLRRVYFDVLAGAEAWDELAAEDPTDERAHREIMRARLAAEDRGGALRQFQILSAALGEIGATPSDASVAVYESALGAPDTEAPTPAERARSLLAWGVVHWERSDLVEAQRAAEQVKALAVDAGLGRAFVEATQLLGLVAYAQGAWREHFGQTVIEAIQRTPEMAAFVFDAHVCLTEFSLHQADGITAALQLADRILAAADAASSTDGRALGLLLRGEAVLARTTTPREAAPLLEEALRLHQQADRSTGCVVSMERLAQVHDVVGDQDTARTLHARALQLSQGSVMAAHLVPFVYGGMIQSAPPVAVAGLLDAAALAGAHLTLCETCSMPVHVFSIPALARTGSLELAREHLSAAERTVVRWSGGDWQAAVLEGRAAVAIAEGAPPNQVRSLLRQAERGYTATLRAREADRCRRLAAPWQHRGGTAEERRPPSLA